MLPHLILTTTLLGRYDLMRTLRLRVNQNQTHFWQTIKPMHACFYHQVTPLPQEGEGLHGDMTYQEHGSLTAGKGCNIKLWDFNMSELTSIYIWISLGYAIIQRKWNKFKVTENIWNMQSLKHIPRLHRVTSYKLSTTMSPTFPSSS